MYSYIKYYESIRGMSTMSIYNDIKGHVLYRFICVCSFKTLRNMDKNKSFQIVLLTIISVKMLTFYNLYLHMSEFEFKWVLINTMNLQTLIFINNIINNVYVKTI